MRKFKKEKVTLRNMESFKIESHIEEKNLKVTLRKMESFKMESYIEEENLAARLHVSLLSEKQLQVLQVLSRFVRLADE